MLATIFSPVIKGYIVLLIRVPPVFMPTLGAEESYVHFGGICNILSAVSLENSALFHLIREGMAGVSFGPKHLITKLDVFPKL